MTNRSHRRRGFTLIETAVVFAVAGMLAALLAEIGPLLGEPEEGH